VVKQEGKSSFESNERKCDSEESGKRKGKEMEETPDSDRP
jgi:hypothetical protein